ncbi:MAG TPA: AHH domain-containing protein [Archangium sp.]|uniref:AHH domain-containing protein n=1 Tax=Archangium sp. TaxID=1872627 RepID=UPI002E31F439|nr:AHH domain-containing protein [Archangium sp.]HEX5751546.1 AHH domain-containing protein [Archangium sp.]
MSPRLVLALGLLLLVPRWARAASPESESRLSVLEGVAVSGHHSPTYGHGLELTFKPLGPDPALARLAVEDARAFVEALETAFQMPMPRSVRSFESGRPRATVTVDLFSEPSPGARLSDLERRVREAYAQLYGPPSMPLLSSLESSRWFHALKLSPRYMDEGVRAAAVELLSSPTVAYSMALSMMLYMAAWAAPEPVFSKALAGAITLGLLLTYSAAELYTVGLACLNLYREAEAARTQEQLEAAAERFGRAIGGVGLRVLVTVAGAKLAKGLPEVPKGGMWARFSPPRFAFAGGGARGGFSVGGGTRAQVNVANGTVVLMGVSANTAATAVSAAVTSARTSGACRDASDKGEAKAHHLATNKNDISDVSGGPWTPRFEILFARAAMSLDDPANIVYLIAHQGPHPEAYHQEIYTRLETALGRCRGKVECRAKIVEELDQIAADICKPGSVLNKLLTKKP